MSFSRVAFRQADRELIAGDEMYLSDWKEFWLADPAPDVGPFAGEWLYYSALDITVRNYISKTITKLRTRKPIDAVLIAGQNNWL